ncbi:hypothetical protein K9T58_00015, partial [Escherichia coli]|nr:hypothetical protein [Escherichia coli]
MKKTAPDGAVSGMPAIRETGPGKNLQAITVSDKASRVKTHYPNNSSLTSIASSNECSRAWWSKICPL